ncbi:MAG: AbrB/MazE/SpoVT family DNA-binding domain-containing protein [Paenisporosarcina sp.]
MEIAKMTSKGQVTIPKSIRMVLDVHEGDRLTFIEEDGFVIMTKANLKYLNELEEILSDEKFKEIIQKAKLHLNNKD